MRWKPLSGDGIAIQQTAAGSIIALVASIPGGNDQWIDIRIYQCADGKGVRGEWHVVK